MGRIYRFIMSVRRQNARLTGDCFESMKKGDNTLCCRLFLLLLHLVSSNRFRLNHGFGNVGCMEVISTAVFQCRMIC